MTEHIYSFTLPWPSKRLARWYKPKGDERERAECWAESNAFKILRQRHPLISIQPGASVELVFIFVPPNCRKRNVFTLVDRMAPAKAGVLRYLDLPEGAVNVTQRLSKSPIPRGQVLCHLKITQPLNREAIQEDLFGMV